MAKFSWPPTILGACMALGALAANALAQNPLNLAPPISSLGSGGPSLGPAGGPGAPGDARGLEPVDDEPELAPVDSPSRPPRGTRPKSAPSGDPGRQSSDPARRYGDPSHSHGPAARSKQAPSRRPSREPSESMRQDPNARRVSAQATAASGTGEALMQEAYKRSVTATDDAGYTQTIETCRDALQAGVAGNGAVYLRRLMAWAYNKRGECRSAAGQDAPAFEDFQAAVDLDNTSWRALHNRGVSLAGMGKTQEAVEDFSRAIEINRDFGLAYFNRGEMRYEQGDFTAAIEDYNIAAKSMSGDAGVYNSRGHAQYRLRHFKEAVADFNIALKVDPHNAAALVNRGDVYADTSFYAEAAADYKAAIHIEPGLGRAYQSVAWLMATCPDKQFRNASLALEAAQRALAIDGRGDYRYLATLAAAQATGGKFEDAVRTQGEAVAAAPASARPTQEKRLALYKARKPFYTAQHDSQGRIGGQIRNAPKQR